MSDLREVWRCFHCDEVFTDRQQAYDHFGPDDACEKLPAACVDPLRVDEKERIKELRDAQEYALQCQQKANEAEDERDEMKRELAKAQTTFAEICICAAIKLFDDTIIRGHRHHACIWYVRQMPQKSLHGRTDGFITSRNRFVDREEGLRLQKAAGIPSASPDGYMSHGLCSEDLY